MYFHESFSSFLSIFQTICLLLEMENPQNASRLQENIPLMFERVKRKNYIVARIQPTRQSTWFEGLRQ